MTTIGPTVISRRDRRPPRRSAAVRWIVRALVLGAVFALGVALGEALNDNPRSGGQRTIVRTLQPFPVTVTVTTAP